MRIATPFHHVTIRHGSKRQKGQPKARKSTADFSEKHTRPLSLKQRIVQRCKKSNRKKSAEPNPLLPRFMAAASIPLVLLASAATLVAQKKWGA